MFYDKIDDMIYDEMDDDQSVTSLVYDYDFGIPTKTRQVKFLMVSL